MIERQQTCTEENKKPQNYNGLLLAIVPSFAMKPFRCFSDAKTIAKLYFQPQLRRQQLRMDWIVLINRSA